MATPILTQEFLQSENRQKNKLLFSNASRCSIEKPKAGGSVFRIRMLDPPDLPSGNDELFIDTLVAFHLFNVIWVASFDPIPYMKIRTIVCTVLAAALLAGCVSENHEQKEAMLMSQAKVSKEDAQKTALAKVPNGTIKDGELEKEHGKLQWSFDVATPDSKDITEVNVDAITGEVISMDKEAPEKEAKEAKEEDEKK
jgi:hypothetical protein